jgi:hypothetical protein
MAGEKQSIFRQLDPVDAHVSRGFHSFTVAKFRNCGIDSGFLRGHDDDFHH